ncbi:MAG: FIST C-terminal domain-containing protein [Spirochaetales bacterium]|nr:FIST C-terminal domain-containing protein [Spirochaetales bacterium]
MREIKTGIGTSFLDKTESFKAGAAAITVALDNLGEKPDLLFIFTTFEYFHDEVLKGVYSLIKDVPSLGCAADGVFANSNVKTKEMVAVMALSLPGCEVSVIYRENIKNIFDTSKKLGEQFLSSISRPDFIKGNSLIYVLNNNKLTNDIVARGLVNIIGPMCNIIGGAVDGFQGGNMGPFANGKVLNDGLVLLFIQSKSPLGAGVAHGWKAFGTPLVATHTEGNRIYTLNGQPAHKIYKNFFIEKYPHIKEIDFVTDQPAFYKFAAYHPVGLAKMKGEYLIRDPYAILEDGSIVCGGEIPENSIIHLMEGTNEALLAATESATAEGMNKCGDKKLAGAVFFNCVTRLWQPNFDISSDLKIIRKKLGPNIPILGIMTRGEFATPGSGIAAFHNKTFCISLIST